MQVTAGCEQSVALLVSTHKPSPRGAVHLIGAAALASSGLTREVDSKVFFCVYCLMTFLTDGATVLFALSLHAALCSLGTVLVYHSLFFAESLFCCSAALSSFCPGRMSTG